MDRLENIIQQNVGRVEQRQQMVCVDQPKSQNSISKARVTKSTIEEIGALVGEVELAKQIHLSDAERAVLQGDLYALGEPIEKLRKRAEYVKRITTYGKISIDLWLSAEPLYTETEAQEIVEMRIAKRRQEFIEKTNGVFSEEDMARRGLIELQIYWNNEARRMIRKHYERQEQRAKKIRAQFFYLPDQTKIDLWQRAVSRGIVGDGDAHLMQVLPMLIPQMFEDFEEAIKNNSFKV